MKKSSSIRIKQTEQWEYMAIGHGLSATGTSEQSAELRLLRKIVDKLLKEKVVKPLHNHIQ